VNQNETQIALLSLPTVMLKTSTEKSGLFKRSPVLPRLKRTDARVVTMKFVQQPHMLLPIHHKTLVELRPGVIGISHVGLRVTIAGHVVKERSHA
jgi:hypothetical protein